MTKLDAFMAACAAIAAMLLAHPDANAQGIERDSTHGIIRPSVTSAPQADDDSDDADGGAGE